MIKENPSIADAPESPESSERDAIIGRNPVLEALKSGRTINKIFIQKGEREGSVRRIESMAAERGIVVSEASRLKLDALAGGLPHQGVAAMAAAWSYVGVDDILKIADERGEPHFVILLDEIEDPHNFGSILRSAEAAGAHGVIIPKRRSVGLTSAVAKASSGALEYIGVARVTNLVESMRYLKSRGLWITGAAASGGADYTECGFAGSSALVIGSEGRGLGRLVAENCDFMASLPMLGRIGSLNAGAAACVLMYEVVRQRRQSLRQLSEPSARPAQP